MSKQHEYRVFRRRGITAAPTALAAIAAVAEKFSAKG